MGTETEKSLIREIMSRVGGKGTGTSAATPTNPADDYRALARQAATQAGIDPDLFDSLIRNESAYNPEAVSPDGAIGLSQLMPATAAELGVDPNDPASNLLGGATYLRQMLDRYKGDTTKAVAAYNAGPGKVDQYGGVPPYKETRDYVRNVLGGKQPYKLSPLPPPTQAEYGPQQGVPDWVPADLNPIARRMIAKLGPPPELPQFPQIDFANAAQGAPAPVQGEEMQAPVPPQPHTIGDRIMSGAYSFGQGIGTLPTGMLDSMSIIAKHSNAMFGQQKELDEYATSYISRQIKNAANFYFPEDKILQGEFLSQMLPNALGQGLGFIAGGLATGGAYAFPAVAGAAIGGAQAYQEAQAAGAPEDQQLLTYLLNAGIGTSEALPIGHLIEGLDKGTGGVFKRALVEAGKQTFEEGVQEALQQTGGNVVAKWLYDNQRDLMDQVFVSGQVGGAAGAIQGFLTQLLAGALGVRTHHLGHPDPRVRKDALDEEEEAPPMPGEVPPERPTGGPEPPPPAGPTAAPPEPPGTLPTQNEMLQRYQDLLKQRRKILEGRMAEIPEVPPRTPIGVTTLAQEDAREWIPWISEGEIQSSSNLPGLIEVAQNRMAAYREKTLTDQATEEEQKMLAKPGAPRQLLFNLIEERLAQQPPSESPPIMPETLEPTEKLAPVPPSARPTVEEPPVVAPPPEAPVPPVEPGPVAAEPAGPDFAPAGELEAADQEGIRKYLEEHLAKKGNVSRETIPQVTGEETAAPGFQGKADKDLEAFAQTVPARDFKVGERFTGVDGAQYEVKEAAGGGRLIVGPRGGIPVAGDHPIRFIDRFTPGAGPGATAGMTAPRKGKAAKVEDAFASAPPEVRQMLLREAIRAHNRGTQTTEGISALLEKTYGPGIKDFLGGLHKKLQSFPAFRPPKEAPGVKRGAPTGPTVPAGEEKGGGPPTGPVPERERPGKPGEGLAEPSGKEAPKPGAAEGTPAVTREIREGGIATISRELLPVLRPSEFEDNLPARIINEVARKTGKKPLPHQIENAVRTLKAFGFDLLNVTGIPSALKTMGRITHSFLIADGTGTGKTLSAGLVIAAFFEKDPKANILIVVRNGDLAKQWISDVAGPMGWKATLVDRENPLRAGKEGTIHFMTYKRMELAWTEKTMPEIEKFAPDLLLLDESQALKNFVPDIDKGQAVVKTASACEAATRFSKNTLFMSATPFESVLHTAYLTSTKLWFPKVQWKAWLQDKLGIRFKDGVWSGLSPKKLAKFHKEMISQGRMTKSEIDFKKLKNSEGKKITLTTENIKVPRTTAQQAEYERIGRIFYDLLEDPEIKRSPYKRRLVKSLQYIVFRALDEENKLPRAIELGLKAKADGNTVIFTLFRKNDTDLEVWWNNILQGKRGSGKGKPYGPKSYMPALVQYLASNRINIKSPVKVLQEAFPDFVPITGDEVSGGAVRQTNVERLMKGEAPGAIITMAAGGTGLSLHDTIGKFPRVQINISAPDTAGTMVQVAGRTFRLGSESSTKQYWLFGDTPTEGRLAAKIAWRLREMGALVTGKEENPTAAEIEQFDFPEDPAGESEVEMIDALLRDVHVPEEEEEEEISPADETMEMAGERKPYFLGPDPNKPGDEVWNVPEGDGFTTVNRSSFEKKGGTLPEAPATPTGPEAEMLPFKEENRARNLVGKGKAPDIFEARRRILADQEAAKERDYYKEATTPTAEEIKNRTKASQILTEEDVEQVLREERRTDMFARAITVMEQVGADPREARHITGEEAAKIAVLPKAEATVEAQRLLAKMREEEQSGETAEYAFIPHLHRTPSSGGTVTNLKSMREMIADLMKVLETRQAVGWFRPGGKGAKWVLAHFEIWRNIIRGRVFHDVEVISHEAGHRLDQIMFPKPPGPGLGAASDPEVLKHQKELLAIATAAKPGQSKVSEGFAEFVRFYITNEEQAKKAAPGFYPWFEEKLKRELPDVYDVFMGVRADWENMMSADPVKAVEMTIMSGAIKGNRIPKKYYPNKYYQAVVDEMAVIRNATNHLLELAKKWNLNRELPAHLDPRVLASTYVAWPDWVETWVKRGQYSWKEPGKKIGRSLLEIYKPVGNKIKEYSAYAKSVDAIHDLETKGWDPWERYGIYENHARETIERLKGKYESVRKEEVQFFANIVDVWVESGMMKPELAKKMRSKKGIYSPMFRVMIDRMLEDFEVPGGAGKRFANLPTVTYMRKGTRLETIPNIEAAYKMLMVTFKRAEENAVPLGIYELAESVPDGGRDVAAKVPKPLIPVSVSPWEVLKQSNIPDNIMKEIIEEVDPEVLAQAVTIFRPSPFNPKAPYMWVWQGGEKVYVEFDPEIYKALHFMGRHDFGVLEKALAPFVDALRAGAITLSPSFHLRSAIKDPWTALFQSSNPVLHAAYWVPSLVSALTHGESYQRYKRALGGVSTFLGIQPEDVAKVAQRDINRRYAATSYWSNPKNWAHEVFGTMSYLGLALEYMPRIAEARVHGLMTAQTRGEFLKAGMAGRNATVDFNMMGGFSRNMTRTAAFFGVGQAGIARMMREFRTKPFSAAVKFAIFGLLPVAYYFMYVKDDDEKNDNRWSKIPQKERDQNFIFWLPGMDEPRRIPKPHEWGTLMTVAERIMQFQYDKDPRVFKELAWNTMKNLPNPVPTGGMLAWDLARNYSWHLGRPISPTRGEPGEQYFNYTTETAKGIGRLLHMSPAKIEYGLRQVTGGGYGRVVPYVEEALGSQVSKRGLSSAAEEPVVGTLTYRYPTQATENQNRFYDEYWVPASEVYESFTGKKKHAPEDVKRYLQKKSNWLATYYALKGIDRTLASMRSVRDLILSDQKMSDEEKRKKLVKLSNEMDSLAAKGVEIGQKIIGGKSSPQPAAPAAPGVH